MKGLGRKNFIMQVTGIIVAFVLVISVLSTVPTGKTNTDTILPPDEAYAFTLNSVAYSYEISHSLFCESYSLSAGGEGIFGVADFIMFTEMERLSTGSSTTVDIKVFWLPHKNDNTHLAFKSMLIGDDVFLPELVGDIIQDFDNLGWALPSHDNNSGHPGEFTLQFLDNAGGGKNVRIFYPSCAQGNTAAP